MAVRKPAAGATLQAVADTAGVSIATASRVLNGATPTKRVSADCARKVQQAALALGYVAGYHRRAIRSGLAETLGVVLEPYGPTRQPDLPSALAQPFFSRLVAGVEQATHAAGYNLALVVPSQSQRANVRGCQQLREHRLDGLVLLPSNREDINTQTLREAPELPMVCILPVVETALPTIRSDEEGAVALLVDLLYQLGHRHLLYCGEDHQGEQLSAGYARERHFLAAACAHGIRGECCRYRLPDADSRSVTNIEARDRQVAAFFAERRRSLGHLDFTGVVAYNDVTAISVCRIALGQGLSVPRDLSVVGIDSLDSESMVLPLTSVDMGLVDMGLKAGSWTLDLVRGGPEAIAAARCQHQLIQPRLVRRDSAGPPPPTR